MIFFYKYPSQTVELYISCLTGEGWMEGMRGFVFDLGGLPDHIAHKDGTVKDGEPISLDCDAG